VCYDSVHDRIISGSDNTIYVWSFNEESQKYQLFNRLEGHSYPVTSVCYDSVHDRIISGSRDGTIGVWSFNEENKKYQLLHRLKGLSDSVYNSVCYDPVHDRIISGSWNMVSLMYGIQTVSL
jgi:WD40 repeat protein